MRRTLESNPHVTLEEDRERRLVLVTRSDSRPESPEALVDAYRAIQRHIRPDHRTYGLVLDTRAPTGRNGESWERGMVEVRQAMAAFARVAVLVRTAAGKLQAQRLARAERLDTEMLVTDDEGAAVAFAAGERGPAKIDRRV